MDAPQNFFPNNQTWLHQKLKNYYLTHVGGTEEVSFQINGKKYRVDVLNKERTVVYEVHRSNFGKKFSRKIKGLLQLPMKIIIVHPIILKQKVTRMDRGEIVNVSYYNKHGNIYSLFEKLVNFKVEFIPQRMEFEVLFINEHVLKEFTGFYRRGRKRKYKIIQRDLVSIVNTHILNTKADFIKLLPTGLPYVFTNQDIADRLRIQGNGRKKLRIPGLMTYSLCKLGILDHVGRRGRAYEFSIRN